MVDPAESVQSAMNFSQKMVVILANVLLLGELTFSIYLGHQDPENLTIIFLRTFIPMVLCTLVLAKVIIRRLGPR